MKIRIMNFIKQAAAEMFRTETGLMEIWSLPSGHSVLFNKLVRTLEPIDESPVTLGNTNTN